MYIYIYVYIGYNNNNNLCFSPKCRKINREKINAVYETI